jgi:protein-tyrosine phosphatase
MADDRVADDQLFSVLMVCTGNIGRSPMMERLMIRELVARGVGDDVAVASAGTFAQDGRTMEPGAARALSELGVDVDGFTATALTPAMIAASDLVVVATREHRSEVVNLLPAAVRRTFTLRELGRIATTAPPVPGTSSVDDEVLARRQQMRDAVAWAGQVRGSVPRPDPEDVDDLADPLGASDQVYRERAAVIVASVERIVAYLLADRSAG